MDHRTVDIEHLAAVVASLPKQPLPERDLWLDEHGNVVGRFLNCHLSSVYQPLRDLATGSDIGHEAFIRSRGGRSDSLLDVESGLSPWNLFSAAAGDDELVQLDRLCRKLQAIGYFANHPEPQQLFVNVHGRLLVAVREDHGRTYRQALESLGISPGRIVIESPEALAENLLLLSFVLHNYRLNGYRTAVNLASPDQIIPLLEHFRPDYVKLDVRSFNGAESLGRVLALVQQYGVELILKRVQSESQHRLIEQSGATLAQGFLFGAASPLGPIRRSQGVQSAASNDAAFADKEIFGHGIRHR